MNLRSCVLGLARISYMSLRSSGSSEVLDFQACASSNRLIACSLRAANSLSNLSWIRSWAWERQTLLYHGVVRPQSKFVCNLCFFKWRTISSSSIKWLFASRYMISKFCKRQQLIRAKQLRLNAFRENLFWTSFRKAEKSAPSLPPSVAIYASISFLVYSSSSLSYVGCTAELVLDFLIELSLCFILSFLYRQAVWFIASFV